MFLICFECCLPICLMTIGKVTVKFQVVDIFQELYQKGRGNDDTKERRNEERGWCSAQ